MRGRPVPACDLGALSVSMHDDISGMIGHCDPRHLKQIETVMRRGCLNDAGELVDDDTIILGNPQAEHRAVLRCVYEHLAASFEVALSCDAWLDKCDQDGQFIACFAVGYHNDDGVGEQGDRVLLVLRSPGYYRFDTFDERGVKRFEKTINCGDLVLFDENHNHQLVMIGAGALCDQEFLRDRETGYLPESQLAYVLNLPSPLISDH